MNSQLYVSTFLVCMRWKGRRSATHTNSLAPRRHTHTHSHAILLLLLWPQLTCIPGVINYKGARLQLLDMPGIIEGAKDGKGRGRQVIGTARTCDVILIVLDAAKPLTHKRIIEKELEGMGIRLNKRPPNITFTKKEKGGIAYRSTMAQTLDEDTVRAICAEYKMHNCEIQVREPNVTADQLIDVLEGKNIVYIP